MTTNSNSTQELVSISRPSPTNDPSSYYSPLQWCLEIDGLCNYLLSYCVTCPEKDTRDISNNDTNGLPPAISTSHSGSWGFDHLLNWSYSDTLSHEYKECLQGHDPNSTEKTLPLNPIITNDNTKGLTPCKERGNSKKIIDHAFLHDVLLDGLLEDARNRRTFSQSLGTSRNLSFPTLPNSSNRSRKNKNVKSVINSSNKNKSKPKSSSSISKLRPPSPRSKINNSPSRHYNGSNTSCKSVRNHTRKRRRMRRLKLAPSPEGHMRRSRRSTPHAIYQEHSEVPSQGTPSSCNTPVSQRTESTPLSLMRTSSKEKLVLDEIKTNTCLARLSLSQHSNQVIIDKQHAFLPTHTPSRKVQRSISLLHPNCTLQKDGGQGQPFGKMVSASGRDGVLNKLGEKMDILVELEEGDAWKAAVTLRTPAAIVPLTPMAGKALEWMAPSPTGINHVKVREWDGKGSTVGGVEDASCHKSTNSNNIIERQETRSMIGVKMGFVSIRYGVAMHWREGHVEFVLLRKMCPQSFMQGDSSDSSKHSSNGATKYVTQLLDWKRGTSTSFSNEDHSVPVNSDASKSKSVLVKETKVSSSPYSVIEDKFHQHSSVQTSVSNIHCKSSLLYVTILRARGLQGRGSLQADRFLNPYVIVSFGSHTQRTNVIRRSNRPSWRQGERHSCLFSITSNFRFLGKLKVTLHDHRPFGVDVLLGTVYVPLSLLQDKCSSKPPLQMTIPCKMIRSRDGQNGSRPYGSITLSLDVEHASIKDEIMEHEATSGLFC